MFSSLRRRPYCCVLAAIPVIALLAAVSVSARAETADEPQAKASEPPSAPAEENDRRGVIVPVSAEITDVTTESIKRRVERAIDDGADTIIFEIDTPGGYVTSALDICNYIKNLENVRTIAWVNTDAYSAGSMISVACDEIVMARASTLGDCGVILGGPTGAQEVPEGIRAKAESPVLEQFRDSAARNGYDILLCESMVVKEYEVWWIENTKTGERRFVDADDKVALVGGEKPKRKVLGLEMPSLAAAPEWKLVESYDDPVSEQSIPVDQPIVKTTELLTMSQSRAQAFGFSKAIVTGEKDLRERYQLTGELRRIEFTTLEVLTRWLTSMPVRGFLMIIILLGAYVEFNTPGVGVAGLVALIALAVFVGAPYVTGLANIWEIMFIVLGLGLIALEVLVIPGFGIPGLAGIILLIVGLLATFMPDEPGRWPVYWPSLEPGLDGLKRGVQTLTVATILAISGMVMLSKYLPKMPYFKAIIPENPTPSSTIVGDPYHGLARVGDVGRTETILRPAGKARFGSMLVDVVAQGDIVDQGLDVEVIERRGNRVVVRRLNA